MRGSITINLLLVNIKNQNPVVILLVIIKFNIIILCLGLSLIYIDTINLRSAH